MFLYRWTIEKIEGFPEMGELANVVGNVFWELEIRDTEDHSIHYIRRNTILSAPSEDSFIDHLELDSDTILGWVWNIIGKEALEKEITDELNALRSPKPVTASTQLSMPWMASCCPDGTGIDGDPA
jgi:hypothetical protein